MAHAHRVGQGKSGKLTQFSTSFCWNLDAHVGLGAPNRSTDVQLVQLAYFCMGTVLRNVAPVDPALMAVCRLISPGEPYFGRPDENLSIAIVTQQRLRGGIQDGRVSPIQGNHMEYGGGKTWMLAPLNSHIARILGTNTVGVPGNWPKLHLHPRCPSDLAAISRDVFTVSPATLI
jgi:hypothetical protein